MRIYKNIDLRDQITKIYNIYEDSTPNTPNTITWTTITNMVQPFNLDFDSYSEAEILFRETFDRVQDVESHEALRQAAIGAIVNAFDEPIRSYLIYQRMLIESGNHPGYKKGYVTLKDTKKIYWIRWQSEMVMTLYVMNKIRELGGHIDFKAPKRLILGGEIKERIRQTKMFADIDFRYPEYKSLEGKIVLIGEMIYGS